MPSVYTWYIKYSAVVVGAETSTQTNYFCSDSMCQFEHVRIQFGC